MIHTSATVGFSEGRFHVTIETRFQSFPNRPSQPMSMYRFDVPDEESAKRIAVEINRAMLS